VANSQGKGTKQAFDAPFDAAWRAAVDAAQQTVIQIWDAAGLHLYNSYPGHTPPPQTGPGWTTVTTRHGAWHIFSLHDDERIIQVAQPLAVRSALAVQMAVRTLLP